MEFIKKLGDINKFEFCSLNETYSLDDALKQKKCIYFLGELDKPKQGTRRETSDDSIVSKKYFVIDLDLRKDMAKVGIDCSDDDIYNLAEQIKTDIEDDDYFNKRSYIVFTGNGLHIYYVGDYITEINKEIYTAGVQKIYERFNTIFEDKYGKENMIQTDKSTSNIGRILRLPGTKNYKDKDNIKETKILFEQDETSKLVSMISDFGAKHIKELEKREMIQRKIEKENRTINRELSKVTTDEIKDLIDSKDIYEIVDICGIAHSNHRLYYDGRQTNGWRINKQQNYVNNFNEGEGRADGGPYSFVMKHFKYDTGQTIDRFCEKFTDIDDLVKKEKIQYKNNKTKTQPVEANRDVWIDDEDISFDHTTKIPYTRGTDSVDNAFCKPEPDDFLVLIGAPGMGKTEYSYFIARENVKLGNKVLYLSLELTRGALFKRLAIRKSGLKYIDVQNLKYTSGQEVKLDRELEKLKSQKGITIFGASKNPTIKEVKDIIMKKCAEGYNMFIIDNLGKISREGDNEINGFDRITSDLQNLKDDIRCPIVLLHHTVKPAKPTASTMTQTKKPAGSSGFRGSQKIEDNSTIMQEIWRDTSSDGTEEPDKDVEIYQYKHTKTGITGNVTLEFSKGDYIKKEFNY